MLQHPPDGRGLVGTGSELSPCVSLFRGSPSHFGGLCHTAGLWQKAGNNVGTGRNSPAPTSHWKAFFGSLTSSPNFSPSQRGKQTQCLLAAGKSLTHFLQLQTRRQSQSDIAGTAWSILTPLQRQLLNKKQSHKIWTLQEPNWGWDIAAQENNLFPGR